MANSSNSEEIQLSHQNSNVDVCSNFPVWVVVGKRAVSKLLDYQSYLTEIVKFGMHVYRIN